MKRSVLARWAAPLMLVIVATAQIVRVHTIDQSPWSGSGFGMFAAVDGEDTRWVRGRLLEPDGSTTVLLPPPDLARAAFKARVLPSDNRLRHLAERWAAALDGPGTLVVEVWAPRFERGPAHLTADLLATLRIDVTGAGDTDG